MFDSQNQCHTTTKLHVSYARQGKQVPSRFIQIGHILIMLESIKVCPFFEIFFITEHIQILKFK